MQLIQHCDVKPDNILLIGGVVAVCDFGLAKVAQSDYRESIAGPRGSPAYAAPEALQNDPEIGPTVDQYSLAITYYDLATGELPFDAPPSLLALIAMKERNELDLSLVAEAQREILSKATSADPAQRFPSCGEFVQALRAAVRHDQIAAGIDPDEVTKSMTFKPIGPGAEVVPGYRLGEKVYEDRYEQQWEADYSTGNKPKIIHTRAWHNHPMRSTRSP